MYINAFKYRTKLKYDRKILCKVIAISTTYMQKKKFKSVAHMHG